MTDENIRDLIEGEGIGGEMQISHGSVYTITTEHLGFRKVCARWVPWLLTNDQKQV